MKEKCSWFAELTSLADAAVRKPCSSAQGTQRPLGLSLEAGNSSPGFSLLPFSLFACSPFSTE